MGILRKLDEFLLLLLIKCGVVFVFQRLFSLVFIHLDILLFISETVMLEIDSIPSPVGLDVVDNINECPIYVLQSSVVLVNSHSRRFVNSNDLDSITWLYIVHQVFVGTQLDGVGSLSLWHALRGFLELDVLLIVEVAAVVDHLESSLALAIVASVWLGNSSSLNVDVLHRLALEALECCLLHLGDDV